VKPIIIVPIIVITIFLNEERFFVWERISIYLLNSIDIPATRANINALRRKALKMVVLRKLIKGLNFIFLPYRKDKKK